MSIQTLAASDDAGFRASVFRIPADFGLRLGAGTREAVGIREWVVAGPGSGLGAEATVLRAAGPGGPVGPPTVH